MKQTTCDSAKIERLLDGRLSEADEMALASHLDACDECCALMNERSAGRVVWRETREFLTDISQLPSAPSLRFLAPSDDPAMLGRFGPYDILGLVGSGGMGIVLKGVDAALNRYVAIKVLAPQLATDASARKRFAREAQAAAAVVHDNVIPIYGVDEFNELPYLVMPYVGGSSLQKRIDAEGPLAISEVLRIAAQTATGLAAAHAQGLVHRDIKPANLLLPNSVERVQITDFGLARGADDPTLTKIGVIAGTPEFMSPEQARGEHVDYRSDLFSLGSVMYAMCTGRPAFRAETSYGVLQKISECKPQPIREQFPELPDWLELVVRKLHARFPQDRFASAEETANVLSKCLAHVQNADEPLPACLTDELTRTRTQAGRSSNTRSWTGGAVLLLLFGIATAGVIITIKKDGTTIAALDVPKDTNVKVDPESRVIVELPPTGSKQALNTDPQDHSNVADFSITPADELASAQLTAERDQLLKAHRANNPTAVAEVRKHLRQELDGAALSAEQAELVIARAHGFETWQRLQQHVSGLTADAMCEAAAAGHLQRVRELAERRPELATMERRGNFGEMTPLHFAVINGRVEVVRLLMELGADARCTVYPHRSGTSSFELASIRNATEMMNIIVESEKQRRRTEGLPNESVTEHLVELIATIRGGESEKAIGMLEADETLKTLRDDENSLPLHVAAGSHTVPVLKWLLAHDPDLEAKDNAGRTPMDRAAVSGNHGDEERHTRFRETVKLLLSSGARLTSRTAVVIGDREAVKRMHTAGELEEPRGLYGGGLIDLAVQSNDHEMVKLLLDLGLDPDEPYIQPEAEGDARSWGAPLIRAIEEDRYETAVMLLERGADASANIYASGTPIMRALWHDNDRYLKLLLKYGAQLNLYEISRLGQIDLVKAVLSGRATNKVEQGASGRTPADCADGMLCGAIDGGQVEVLRMCIPHLKSPPGAGLLPRTWWRVERVENLQMLLDAGADPNGVFRFGDTALHDLAKTRLDSEQQRLAFLEPLLKAGARFDKRDIFFESTPLGWACRFGRLELVKRLVESGAPVNEPDAPSWATPLSWAEKMKHQEIAQYLRSKGAEK